ncbi:MAG: TetR/AcrR family transcriptional regulator [Cellvibrionaceae bacterium]|nr:TetR/AcrR family transcriptional regulator [Cellvibrionaceae bacterium]MCV6626685.1 TetR/AcrR family transcriptional regulator [Cellvibrionaceae bacterium]
MTTPLDARAKRSQQALLRAGLELLNINREASLSDIAAHAGVGRTTLYRQYETREKLIAAVAAYCLELFDEATAPIEQQATSALDAIGLVFKLLMPLTQEMQFLIQLDQFEHADPALEQINAKQSQEMDELVAMAKREGSINKSLPNAWVVNLISGIFIASWLQQQDQQTSAEQAAALAFTSFCQGVSG